MVDKGHHGNKTKILGFVCSECGAVYDRIQEASWYRGFVYYEGNLCEECVVRFSHETKDGGEVSLYTCHSLILGRVKES